MRLQYKKAVGYFVFCEFVGFIFVLHELLHCACIVGCSGWHVGGSESKVCGAELPFHQWKPVWGFASWVCRAGSYWKREDGTRSKAPNKKQNGSAVSPEKSQGMSFHHSTAQVSIARSTVFCDWFLSSEVEESDRLTAKRRAWCVRRKQGQVFQQTEIVPVLVINCCFCLLQNTWLCKENTSFLELSQRIIVSCLLLRTPAVGVWALLKTKL